MNIIIFKKMEEYRLNQKIFQKIMNYKKRYVDLQYLAMDEADLFDMNRLKDIEIEEIKLRVNKKQSLWFYSFFFSFACISAISGPSESWMPRPSE